LEEEAVIDKVDGIRMGTGAYCVMLRLTKRLPIPVFGQRVTVSYKGNPTICK
jgi:hypothetical protein